MRSQFPEYPLVDARIYNWRNKVYIRLNTHELLEGIDMLHVLVLHDLVVRHKHSTYSMKPILQKNSDRVDSF